MVLVGEVEVAPHRLFVAGDLLAQRVEALEV